MSSVVVPAEFVPGEYPVGDVAVGVPGAAGTVVAVMLFDALDASEVPYVLVAVTVNVYAVSDCNPVTVIGEDDPVPVYPPGEEVTVNESAAFLASAVNVTVAAPLLYGRDVPTFVAVPIVGA